MDENHKALTVDQLKPNGGRGRRQLAVGDCEDIRLCNDLQVLQVKRNWYVGHKKLIFTTGQIYRYPTGKIAGRKVFLFRATEENKSLAERKGLEQKIINSGNLIKAVDLVLELAGKKPFKPWSDDARSRIQANLSRLSVSDLTKLVLQMDKKESENVE